MRTSAREISLLAFLSSTTACISHLHFRLKSMVVDLCIDGGSAKYRCMGVVFTRRTSCASYLTRAEPRGRENIAKLTKGIPSAYAQCPITWSFRSTHGQSFVKIVPAPLCVRDAVRHQHASSSLKYILSSAQSSDTLSGWTLMQPQPSRAQITCLPTCAQRRG